MKKLIIRAFAPSVLAALSVASAANAQSQGVQQSKTSELAAIAEQVHTGRLPCELGQSVSIELDRRSPTQFYLDFKTNLFLNMYLRNFKFTSTY